MEAAYKTSCFVRPGQQAGDPLGCKRRPLVLTIGAAHAHAFYAVELNMPGVASVFWAYEPLQGLEFNRFR
jgi:hypothetical protein